MVKDSVSPSGWRRGIENENTSPPYPGMHIGVADDFEGAEID
jgi:hypothetical protein